MAARSQPRLRNAWEGLFERALGPLQVDGIIDAQTKNKRGYGGFQSGETCSSDIEYAVGPNQRTGQADDGKRHA